MKPRTRVVLVLGSAQTLAWGSSFYLPAVLAPPMAQELGLATPVIYAVFSMALVVSALSGPMAGRLIDRHGGRPVLMGANGLFAAGLAALGLVHSLAGLLAAWTLLGLAMGAGLYDAAFAALVRLYGREARPAISGITLIAGFASTVGWPLTALLEAQLGWRGACLAWAAVHVLVALPLNARLPVADNNVEAPPAKADIEPTRPAQDPAPPRHLAPLMAAVFALMSLVGTAVATHLPTLLQASGATLAAAVAAGALLGPAQVAARLLELGWLRRRSPLWAARAAALGHPTAAALLLGLGPTGALPFVLLHGFGNGLLTIVRGTLPLAVFGAAGYGARQGWLSLPARMLGALSPWLFGIAMAQWGVAALWITGALGLAAFGGLWLLKLPVR